MASSRAHKGAAALLPLSRKVEAEAVPRLSTPGHRCLSSTASDASGQHGVALVLADGRTATVRFAQDAIGGTLAIRGGGGDVDATLRAGVEALPERE